MKSLPLFGIIVIVVFSAICFACVPAIPEIDVWVLDDNFPCIGETVTIDAEESFCSDAGELKFTWAFPPQAYCIHIYGDRGDHVTCKFNEVGTFDVGLTVENVATGQVAQWSIEAHRTGPGCDDDTFEVSSCRDTWYVSVDGDDYYNGSSWTSAFRNIQTAIDSASDGDEILIDSGDEGTPVTYFEQLDMKGKSLNIHSADPDDQLSGWELAENTIIDAQKQGAVIVYRGNEDVETGASFEGFTITSGYPVVNGDGLALKLDLDDGSGTNAADSSGKERDGSLIFSGVPNWTNDGYLGGALEFDGDDYIRITDYKGVTRHQSMTCAVWIKTIAQGEIISWDAGAIRQNRWYIGVNESGTINGDIIGTTAIDDGIWHHIAVVLEDGFSPEIKLYIDGQLEVTQGYNWPSLVTVMPEQDVMIGSLFDGFIDDVRIYSRALDESEILELSRLEYPILHLKMDDDVSDGYTTDHSENGNDGQVFGASLSTDGYLNGALSFDGDDSVDVIDYDLTSNWSISFWANGSTQTATSPDGSMVFGNGSDDDNFFYMLNGVRARFENSSGLNISWTTDTNFYNTWRHVTLIATDTQVTLYLDGISQGAQTISPTIKLYDIGTGHTTSSYDYTGLIDDFRVYQRVLSSDEIGILADHHPNLIVHYKFDETDQYPTSAIDEINGYTGLVQGDPESSIGVLGGAYSFDGSGDFIIVNGAGSYNQYSISLWFNSTQPNVSDCLFQDAHNAYTQNTGRPEIRVRTNRVCVTGGYTDASLYSGVGMADGNWHHVVATADSISKVVELYVDGRYYGNYDNDGYVYPLDLNNGGTKYSQVQIGTRQNKGTYFTGLIDELKIYDDVLSADEVAMLYSNAASQINQALIAHYKLDGDCTDSVGSHDGTLEEAAATEPGVVGTALKFDGDGDANPEYVQLDPLFDPGKDEFSVFVWARLDCKQGSSYQTILAQENVNGNGRPLLSRKEDGDVLFCYLGGVETVSQSAVFEDLGQWHHVGLTYDGKYVSLYVDGVKEATEIRNGELTDGGLRLAQQKDGVDYAVQAPWNGALDDVRIYNYALSESEVQAVYNTGGGIKGNGATVDISKCIIKENVSEANGGGVAGVDGTITNSFITDNEAKNADGGGLANCDGDITNSVIAENTAENAGAILGGDGGSIINCTIANNSAGNSVGGIKDYTGTITNAIVWGNTDIDATNSIEQAQIYGGAPIVSYSCVQDKMVLDGWVFNGIENLDINPIFIGDGDYHLLSGSLCIDAGNESSDYSLEPSWNGNRINLGAYGNTSEATASQDNDGDGLSNTIEIREGLDPDDVDSDNDGLVDGNSGKVTLADFLALTGYEGVDDGTGIYVAGEQTVGTEAADEDTDHDGVADGFEVIRGTNPLDDTDTPLIGTINVPGDFTTIQDAIDYAIDGDTIVIASGVYDENIHFYGKNILLRSTDPVNRSIVESTVICGEHVAPVVSFSGSENTDCQLRGITIKTSDSVDNKSSLVGHWKFTENDGNKTVVDSSTYGNNGTTKQKTKYMHTAGRNGGSFSFSGSPDYVSIPDDGSLDISDNITISLWMKPAAFTNAYAAYPIRKHVTDNSNFILYFFGDYDGAYPQNLGRLAYYANHGENGAWSSVSGTYYITELNKWYHIVWTYDSTVGGQLYINSETIGNPTGSGLLNLNDTSVLVGNGDYEGLIDDVRIYNEVLTQNEISELYGTSYPAIVGNGSQATISKCNIIGNSSHAPAGLDDFDGTVLDSRIIGNYSYENGGAFADCDGIIANCIVADNGADNVGGGFYNCNGTVVNCTVLKNLSNAGYGGAFADCDDSLAVIANSILYDNGTLPAFNSSELSNCFIGYRSEDDDSEDNPYFVDETDVFGDGLALQEMSPCIDMGSNMLLPETIDTDIDGYERIHDIVDLGAYEFESYEPSANVIYVNWAAEGDDNGISWEHAYTDLATALNASSSGDEVWVAKGTYKPGTSRISRFTVNANVRLYGGFGGYEKSRNQRDWNQNVTILSGDVDNNEFLDDGNSYQVVWAQSADGAVIDGFTVTMGYAHDENYLDTDWRNHGGAIRAAYADLEINNCTFKKNGAKVSAGAIFFWNGSNSTVNNCQFIENISYDYAGAVNIHTNCDVEIINSYFKGNTAVDKAGALYNTLSTLTLENTIFEENTAENYGGALYISNSPAVNVKDSIFKGNTAGIDGGALINVFSSTVNIKDSIFEGDTAGDDGGAIAVGPDSVAEISDTTFENNEAVDLGGAIYLYGSDAILTITNSSFKSNGSETDSQPQWGGAIYAQSGNFTIEDSSFIDNYGDYGGAGITTESGFVGTIKNCSFSYNRSTYSSSEGSAAGAAINNFGDLTLLSSTITKNTACIGGGFNNGGEAEVRSCLFDSNLSLEHTGAIHTKGGVLKLFNCTVVKNHSNGVYGGVRLKDQGTIGVTNCLLWGNTDNSASTTTVEKQLDTYNDWGWWLTKSIIQGAPTSWSGAIQTTDPKFVDFNGEDYHIKSNSPARDAGDNNFTTETDIDGDSCPMGSAMDVGADEYFELDGGYQPSPPDWDLEPVRTGPHNIVMSVEKVENQYGEVEYYFRNVTYYDLHTGNNPTLHDSGWTTSLHYEDGGLAANTQYTYQVQVRDIYGVPSSWSPSRSALTLESDNISPFPETMAFETNPVAISDCAVNMTAVEAYDPSGVEYYFKNVTVSDGSHDSGWQDSRTYKDTGLSPDTQYTYQVTARDKSENHNSTTTASASATTYVVDNDPPDPENMDFEVPPMPNGSYSVSMSAVVASDTSPVEYYFEEISGNPGGSDSGWQASPLYTDDDLYPNTIYQYRVKARDLSSNLNETNYSDPHSVITYISLDLKAPTPNPPTWQQIPISTDSYSIRMRATTAYDNSGVEYYFEETSGNSGGSDSGWQTSPEYVDSGLQSGIEYSYRVKYRDKSPFQNETCWSESKSATTSSGVVDNDPPTPNPAEWDVEPRALSQNSIIMGASSAATDLSGVQYYFKNVTVSDGSHDSGWQDNPVYTDVGLQPGQTYEYLVKFRDKSSNLNETAYSVDLKGATTFSIFDVNFSIEDLGNGQIQIGYTSNSGVDIRSLALSCDLDNAQMLSEADVVSVNSVFNYYMDYVKDNPGALLGQGHPIANTDSAGVPDFATAISVFSLNMACFDSLGGQSTAPTDVDNVITLQLYGSGTNTIVISEDLLRSSFTSQGITTNLPISLDISLD